MDNGYKWTAKYRVGDVFVWTGVVKRGVACWWAVTGIAYGPVEPVYFIESHPYARIETEVGESDLDTLFKKI